MNKIPSGLIDLPDAEIARILGVSRQRIWQMRKTAAGLCTRCGGAPVEKGHRFLCQECREVQNHERWLLKYEREKK